jgi:hypothetical protein
MRMASKKPSGQLLDLIGSSMTASPSRRMEIVGVSKRYSSGSRTVSPARLAHVDAALDFHFVLSLRGLIAAEAARHDLQVQLAFLARGAVIVFADNEDRALLADLAHQHSRQAAAGALVAMDVVPLGPRDELAAVGGKQIDVPGGVDLQAVARVQGNSRIHPRRGAAVFGGIHRDFRFRDAREPKDAAQVGELEIDRSEVTCFRLDRGRDDPARDDGILGDDAVLRRHAQLVGRVLGLEPAEAGLRALADFEIGGLGRRLEGRIGRRPQGDQLVHRRLSFLEPLAAQLFHGGLKLFGHALFQVQAHVDLANFRQRHGDFSKFGYDFKAVLQDEHAERAAVAELDLNIGVSIGGFRFGSIVGEACAGPQQGRNKDRET